MRAATHDRYGGSDVVTIADIAEPAIADNQLLVAVHASSVTTADWRLRASAFPGGLWLAGRLMTGLFRPRNCILGMEFSGVVARTGPNVTRFAPGDALFGNAGSGAHAEYLAIDEDAALAAKPPALSHAEAASLPFGAVTALVFLRDFAKLQSGQRVLIIGASGGVGVHAVRIARHLGARVTGVTSTDNVALVRELGADRVVDYRKEKLNDIGETFDLVFDTAGIVRFAEARRLLNVNGLFLPLEFGIGDLLTALWCAITRSGQRIGLHVSGDAQADVEAIAELAATGALKPVIDSRYPLAEIRKAHERVETRHKRGSVIVDVRPDEEAHGAA
ncbi:MAG: NAD(P)-dependent alcohol dehydrogenase [Phyllobacteriaceae bacterium]|nr:NAD(P)-dependent alcohol dehydrogenase [Phyllobacteriaceae bacterium]